MSAAEAADAIAVPETQRVLGFKDDLSPDSNISPDEWEGVDDSPRPPTDEHPANLVASLCDDGLHRPAIDLDTRVALVPSSTPGHFHLYLPDVAMDEGAYFDLLDALAAAGIVGKGYAFHSRRRGASWLRLPGVHKDPETGR